MTADIDKLISKSNERLKFTGVAIKREGRRLVLRAKFPNKPNGAIADRLNLGWHATPELIKKSEAMARKISGEIDLGVFSWEDYLKDSPQLKKTAQNFNSAPLQNLRPLISPSAESKIITAREWAQKFEKDYFDRRDRNNKSLSTWQVEYHSVFKNLPDEPLTPELLKKLALSTKPDTRTRKKYCMCLGALAKFASIEVNLKPYRGNYGINSVKPRIIPEDIEIARFYHQIPHPAWKWVYGMIATYGLRNYEFFRIDVGEFLKNPHQCILTDSKTGARMISPYYPEWVEEFRLTEISLPNLNPERSNRDIGGEAAKYFKSIKCPFTLLPLRHAWAIRTLVFELDISWAAKMMGHSVEIHSKVYHHWISQKQMQAANQKAIANTSRPMPPIIKPSEPAPMINPYTDD
ncbi:integrase family protein [Calothrix sp. NIES-4101]|nr:integrase family protein [Calothrix sp. NIES-4101]